MASAWFLRRFRVRCRFGLPQAQTGLEAQHEHVRDDNQYDKQPVARRESLVKDEDGRNGEHHNSKKDDAAPRPQRPATRLVV